MIDARPLARRDSDAPRVQSEEASQPIPAGWRRALVMPLIILAWLTVAVVGWLLTSWRPILAAPTGAR